MSLLSQVIIGAFEKELEAAGPEVEAYMLQVLGKVGAELMQYVTQKLAPKHVGVSTPQSVE